MEFNETNDLAKHLLGEEKTVDEWAKPIEQVVRDAETQARAHGIKYDNMETAESGDSIIFSLRGRDVAIYYVDSHTIDKI